MNKLLAVQGCTVIFDGCKPVKMGVFRKPRFSKDDVEKVMDDFFNSLQVYAHNRYGPKIRSDLLVAPLSFAEDKHAQHGEHRLCEHDCQEHAVRTKTG